MQLLLPPPLLFLALICAGSALGQRPKNTADTAADAVSSVISGLLGRSYAKRQTRVCSAGPGGPVCSATTCCAAGRRCCGATYCCDLSTNCFSVGRCCPLTATLCGGGTACCRAGATCCGSTCCLTGIEVCERGGCINQSDRQRVARYGTTPRRPSDNTAGEDEITKANKELLKTMCEVMKEIAGGDSVNIQVFTYRPRDDLSSGTGMQSSGGCQPGYCSNSVNGGSAFNNSCFQYPPPNTLEDTISVGSAERIRTCVPAAVNAYHGWTTNQMFREYEATNGQEISRGDSFVISLDCDGISVQLPPREVVEMRAAINARDDINPTLVARAPFPGASGTAGVDSGLTPSSGTDNHVLIPIGDLDQGVYTLSIQTQTGSTKNAFVFDRGGDKTHARSNTVVAAGQSQTLSFSLRIAKFGVSVALATSDNATVSWSLTGDVGPVPSTTSSGRTLPTGGAVNPAGIPASAGLALYAGSGTMSMAFGTTLMTLWIFSLTL